MEANKNTKKKKITQLFPLHQAWHNSLPYIVLISKENIFLSVFINKSIE